LQTLNKATFVLALFEEILKLLDQLNISRISGRISGLAVQSSIRPDIKKAGLSGRIFGASLVSTILKNQLF
jgi:hypothetical protein